MRGKCIRAVMGSGLAVLLVIVTSGPVWPQARSLQVGEEAPAFQLPSSQERLVDYYRDYYGRFHLVVTFFPAAFTPV